MVRNQKLCQFSEDLNSWVAVEPVTLYNSKRTRVDNHVYFIGGSEDAECQNACNTVEYYSLSSKKFVQRKPMAYKRGKVGVCSVEVKIHDQ